MDRDDYFFDTATVFRNVVIVTGWHKTPFSIAILYDGKPLPVTQETYSRSDLIELFGAQAETWAFTVCAVAPVAAIDHTRVQFVIDGEALSIWQITNASAVNGSALMHSFLAEVAKAPGSVLEIGSRARSGNSYRNLFPDGIDYVGMDISAGPNVDLVCDAHHMAASLHQKFDYVFSISVFEHILMPWKVALEMNAVMKDHALAYIQSHQAWPLHEEPWDFWRFSANAWKGLFNTHTGFEIVDVGYDVSGHVIPTFAIGGPMQNIDTGRIHLLSACLVKKVGQPLVSWDAEVSSVYDLGYSHG